MIPRRSLIKKDPPPSVTNVVNIAPAISRTVSPVADPKYDQLSALIAVDKNKLDDNVEEQAKVFLEVCENHVRAVSERDLCRDFLSRKDAELARDERLRLATASEKSTEAIITDAVMLNQHHVTASADYARARKNADKWGALRDAFDQRLRMLQTMANLYSSGYWTTSGSMSANKKVSDTQAAQARESLDADRQRRADERKRG